MSENLATATDIAAAVRAGQLNAAQVTEAALTRIATRDASLGAFQLVRAEAARAEARQLDAHPELARLPLAGVPVAIKDNIAVAGEPMRSGSTATAAAPQPADHEVVRRLRQAGAVIVGITRLPELAVFGTTDSAFGITRNPWRPAHTPGGSSGGSAAAVAAGMVPLAHANDGMGSIRIPAACCGLVGIKPGRSVVPAGIGTDDWGGLAENGPLATTVADAALMLSVLAGRPELAAPAEPGRLRIAVSVRVPATGVPLHRAWRAAALSTADLLRGSGHTVVSADPPYGQLLALSELARWTTGTAADADRVLQPERLARRTRRHAALGQNLRRLGLPREAGRQRWQATAERFFAEHDVLITPALAQPPVPAHAWAERGWSSNLISNLRYAPFAAPWNLAGWPAMSVPAGLDPDGLPLAAQLVARPGGEAILLGLAAELERLRPWPRTAPAGTSSVG
ncbi:MAG TPA: amidase family protein [Jatrophihabitans sp.]|nr:amidase family protein [Jatrophihabitans sp.]